MEKKYFRAVTSVLIVLTLVLSLMACGKPKETGDGGENGSKLTEKGDDGKSGEGTTGEELTFWVFHQDAEWDFFEKLPELYKEVNQDVTIVTENVPWDDYMGTKLTTAFAGGEGPDIFLVSPGTIGKYIDSGIALPLDDYMTDEVKNDFSPSSLEGVSLEGSIYAIPFEIELIGLYYDADVFEDAGIAPPKTWDELKTTADTLKSDTKSGLTLEVTKGAYQTFTWYPFMWMTGADIFSADRKTSGIDDEGIVNALSLWRDLIASGGANVKPSRPTNETGIIGDGETAMQICGTWAIAELENTYSDRNIQVVPLPIPEGGENASVAGGWKIMVNAKGKNPEEAAKFAVWAFAEDIDIPLEWCTETKFAYSPRDSVMKAGEEIYNKGLRKVFTEEVYGTEKPEIRMPAEVSNIVENMLQQAMFDTNTPVDQIVKKAHDELEKFLKEYDGAL